MSFLYISETFFIPGNKNPGDPKLDPTLRYEFEHKNISHRNHLLKNK